MWRISLPIVGALLFAGCTVNQDLMFRTEAEYAFASLDETKNAAYTLAPNDRIQLQVYSNRGQRLVSITAGSAEENRGLGMVQNQQRALSSYRVELDGTVELPEVGKVLLGGLTLEEAESTLKMLIEQTTLIPMFCCKWSTTGCWCFQEKPDKRRSLP